MEVSVFREHFFPEGSILSVRAGSVRRQAAISSGRPFKFPGRLENPVKVDVYQPIASGYIVVRPGEQHYKVSWSEDSHLHCELQVKSSSGGTVEVAGQTPRGEEDGKLRADAAANSAKEYLEEHQVLEFIQAVLQTVIKERPVDPFKAMARHFLSGYNSSQERENCKEARTLLVPDPPPLAPLAPLVAHSYPQPLPLQAQLDTTLAPPMGIQTIPPVPTALPYHPGTPPLQIQSVAPIAPLPRAAPPPLQTELVSNAPTLAPVGPQSPSQALGAMTLSPLARGSPNPPPPPPQVGCYTQAYEHVPAPALHPTPALHYLGQSPAPPHGLVQPPAPPHGLMQPPASLHPPPAPPGVGVFPPQLPPTAPLAPPPPMGAPPQLPSLPLQTEEALRPALSLFQPVGNTEPVGVPPTYNRPEGPVMMKTQAPPPPPPPVAPMVSSNMYSPEQVKKALKEQLQVAVTSGDLHKALRQVRGIPESSRIPPPPKAPIPPPPTAQLHDKKVEAMRLTLKGQLERSVRSGDLDEAIRRSQQPPDLSEEEVGSLKCTLQDSLEQLADAGNLNAVIASTSPGLEVEAANVSFTVQNVDYDALHSRKPLLKAFESKVTQTIALEAGARVQPHHVKLTLSPGSVKVAAQVLSIGDDLASVQSALSTSKTLSTRLSESLKCVPGLEEVSCGPIDVVKVAVQISAQGKADVGSQGAEKEDLRLMLKSTLQRSCSSGKLADAMQQVKNSREKNSSDEKVGRSAESASKADLQRMLKDTLQQSCSTGELVRALEKVRGSSDQKSGQEMQRSLKEALSRSVASGDLERALAKAGPSAESTSKADVQRMLKDTLERSCATGELVRALKQERVSFGQKSGQDVHRQLKETLSRSVASGDLGRAFAKLRTSDVSASDAKLTQRQLKETLSRSVVSGDLERAFAKLRPSDVSPSKAELQRALKDTLLRSCSTGELADAMQQVKNLREKNSSDEKVGLSAESASKADLQRMLKNTLQQSCSTGELVRALEKVRGSSDQKSGQDMQRQSLKDTLSRSVASGDLERALAKVRAMEKVRDTSDQRSAQDMQRQSLKETLSRSVVSGDLERALAKLRPSDVSASEAELKRALKDTLHRSCTTGELGRAIEKVRNSSDQKSAKDLQRALKDTLSSSCVSGDLERALAKVRPPAESPHVVDLRRSLKATLESSCATGELGPALDRVQKDSQRRSLKNAFSRSLASGDLERALTTLRPSAESGKLTSESKATEEQLRIGIKGILERSYSNGNLERAFESLQQNSKVPNETQTRETSQEVEKEKLRQSLKDTLSQSVASGQLSQIFEEKQNRERQNRIRYFEVRQKMRSTLENACKTGELERALSITGEASISCKGDVRRQLKDSLERSCSSGDLERVLQKIKASNGSELPGLESSQAPRQILKETLSQSVLNGELDRVLDTLHQTRTSKDVDSVESLRQSLRDTLQRSSVSGDLENAAKVIFDSKVASRELPEAIRTEPGELGKISEERDIPEALRQKLVEGFANAPREKLNGALKDCFMRMRSSDPNAPNPVAPSLPQQESRTMEKDEDVAILKNRLRENFIRHTKTGELDKTLESLKTVKESEQGQLKSVAIDTYQKGTLGTAVMAEAEKNAQSSTEELPHSEIRVALKQALLNSSASGKLQQALQTVNEVAKNEELRTSVRNTLISATASGTLSNTLLDQNDKKARSCPHCGTTFDLDEGDKFCGKCGKELPTPQANELSEEQLREAMVFAREALTSHPLLGMEGNKAIDEKVVNSMRERVKGVFSAAYEKGNLEEVLRSVVEGRPPPTEKDKEGFLRGEVRKSIEDAFVNGTLDKALANEARQNT